MRKLLSYLLILSIVFFPNIAYTESDTNSKEYEIDDLSYDELVALRDKINKRITELNKEKIQKTENTLANDDTELTLASIFEDEALAMYVRDELGKFSIEQSVTQEELDSVRSIEIFSSYNYGAVRSLNGIEYLRNLMTLYLLNDSCSGELTELPETLFTLKSLAYLEISNSVITEIPVEIDQLVNLKSLHIGGNITSLPDSIGNLLSLEYLYVRGNITSLPDSIGNLVNLKCLNVRGTKIISLPDSLANCASLEELCIGSTPITEIPEYIGNFAYLENLDVSYTEISTLPDVLANCTSLKDLDISHTAITKIPESLKSLKLDTVNMEGLTIK